MRLLFETFFSKYSEKTKHWYKNGLITIFFMGVSSGFPFALTATVLSAWLTEAGVSMTSIGLFAFIAIPFSLKYLWAPLVDAIKIPYFSDKLGRRRGWLFVTQTLLMFMIFIFSFNNPAEHLLLCAVLAMFTNFLAATQDIVIDAYRIERLEIKMQSAGSVMTSYGYRLGLYISGVMPLVIATYYGWQVAYMIAAVFMIVGITTTLLTAEPTVEKNHHFDGASSAMEFMDKVIVSPFKDFAKIDGWIIILLFVIMFKLGDAMAGIMTTPFVLSKGFTKIEYAAIVKTYGMVATFAGIFVGGMMIYKLGMMKSLLVSGVLQMLSNLLFIYLDHAGSDILALVITVTGENFSGSLGGVVLISYLSTLCSVSFAATQFALLSSISTISRNVLGGFSGVVVDNYGWTTFFICSTIAAIPALLLIFKIKFFQRHRT